MEDNEIKTGLLFLIKTIDMACFRRSGMQWGLKQKVKKKKEKKERQKERKGKN